MELRNSRTNPHPLKALSEIDSFPEFLSSTFQISLVTFELNRDLSPCRASRNVTHLLPFRFHV
jgi:hypothetical protein